MAVRIIQEIMTGFDADGNPTRRADQVVLARRHTIFSDGTVTIEEFAVEDEDKEVEKSLPDEVKEAKIESSTNFDSIRSVVLENIEKALLGLFRGVLRPLVAFGGKRGAWVTHRGRPLFIDIKRQTIFNVGKDIPKRDVDLIRGVFDSFPPAVKENVTILRIRGSRGLTSKLTKKQLRSISKADEDFFDLVTQQGGQYDDATGVLTIWPESTRISRKLVGGKAGLELETIRELLKHEGGHALFRGGELKSDAFARRLIDFKSISSREGAVSDYAQTFRNFLTAGTQQARGQRVTSTALAAPLPANIPKFGTRKFSEWESIHGRVYATENFAETYKMYLGRAGRRKGDWTRIRRDKPATVKSFLNILEEANAK